MMMNFRTIKSEIVTLLGAAAAGRFRTLGYPSDAMAASGVVNSDRSVQVYNKNGDFPRKSGSLSGPVMHTPTVTIELTASATARGDLSTLDDPGSTPSEFAVAIAAFKDATLAADDSLDELIEIVYQTIMDARNLDLGHADPISERWISSWEKTNPMQQGQYVSIVASMDLTYKIDEQLTGETPRAAEPDKAVNTVIKTYNDEDGDPQGGAAVKAGG